MHISKIKEIVEEDGIVFLTYAGFLSQALITCMTEALEKEAEYNDLSMGTANNIFSIFIELAQNMMNYSKTNVKDCTMIRSQGLIIVSRDKDNSYSIQSQNIISLSDKNKLEPKLQEIISLDKDGLKKRYRELRREGREVHSKGAGIGFYEIAKRCDKVSYEFEDINEDKFYFNFKTSLNTNNKNKG
jgi:hypothetical protein